MLARLDTSSHPFRHVPNSSTARGDCILSSSSMKPSLATLPPELLCKIFEEDRLVSPTTAAICRSLYPFARLNAYRSLDIVDDISFAALGETLEAFPYLGRVVRDITITQTPQAGRGALPFEPPSWLMESWIKAFESMTAVDTISINRLDLSEMLGEQFMASAAFRSAHTLTLSSPEAIPFDDLRFVSLSKNLRSLVISTPMRYQIGRPSGVFSEPNKSPITSLTISAEPHAVEFTPFLEHLSLVSLNLRSSSPDVSRAVESFGPSTRRSLRDFSFGTSSYLQYHLSSLTGLTSLEYLTLWASNLNVAPEFFTHLAPLPLVSVVFRGPLTKHVADPLVQHMINFIESDVRPPSLQAVSVDVDTTLLPAALSSSTGGGEIKLGLSRGGERARLLQAVCQKCGVALGGTIQTALGLVA